MPSLATETYPCQDMNPTAQANVFNRADSLTLSRRLMDLLERKTILDLPAEEECKRLRLAAGLSLRDMGALVGVSGVAIYRYEESMRSPAPSVRGRYSRVLAMLAEVDP